jgi:hypothetical protein
MDTQPGRRDLMRRVGGPAAPAATAASDVTMRAWRAEHLAVPGTGRVRFVPLPSTDDIAHQMARRVAQDPDDARLHVARLNHHLLARDADGAYGALLDLYLAFGSTGGGLRSRLLNGARQLIGPQRAAALDRATASGLAASAPMPASPASMLSRGVTGSTEIVRRRSYRELAS